jgi:GMP synthase (glutamine-hydrolysing)
LLLYKTGETDPRLVCDIGDYEAWFARVLGEACTFELHNGFEAPRCPATRSVRGYDGLLITGSPRSLVEPEPWMDDAAGFVRDAAQAGVPVLGVCFGHQLLGHAFGGRVRLNPNGWEVGTVEVELTDEGQRDPLYAGLPARLRVNQSHRDEVWELGEARRLAGGDHTANQSLAVGAHVRGVQFHPEMNGKVVRRLIHHRRLILDEDAARRGRDVRADSLLEAATDTPDAEKVLQNFALHFVRAA